MKQKLSSALLGLLIVGSMVGCGDANIVEKPSSLTVEPSIKKAEINPRFLAWEKDKTRQSKQNEIGDEHARGYIPPLQMPTIHKPKQQKLLGSANPLASTFDLRDPNLDGNFSDTQLTAVKDQGTCGACWAFASIGSLESTIKIEENLTTDFSENHLKHNHGLEVGACDGGNMAIATAYFSKARGPVSEDDDPYSQNSESSNIVEAIRYIDNIIQLPVRASVSDNSYLKEALVDHGALYVDIHVSGLDATVDNNYSIYNANSIYSDHAVLLVGWDDNYQAQGQTGAFIVKNSWGIEWGESGYFYVPYSDGSFAFGEVAYFNDIPDTEATDFDIVHDTAPNGSISSTSYGANPIYGMSVYPIEVNQIVKSVGIFNSGDDTNVTVSFLKNVSLQDSASFSEETAPEYFSNLKKGWNTLHLQTPVELNTTYDKFSVQVIINENNGTSWLPLDGNQSFTNGDTYSILNPKRNESFYGSDGQNWTDLYDKNASLAIKVFAKSTSTTEENNRSVELLNFIGLDANGSSEDNNLSADDYNTIDGVTGAISENTYAYQEYINTHPADFSSPATASEVQAMIDAVNGGNMDDSTPFSLIASALFDLNNTTSVIELIWDGNVTYNTEGYDLFRNITFKSLSPYDINRTFNSEHNDTKMNLFFNKMEIGTDTIDSNLTIIAHNFTRDDGENSSYINMPVVDFSLPVGMDINITNAQEGRLENNDFFVLTFSERLAQESISVIQNSVNDLFNLDGLINIEVNNSANFNQIIVNFTDGENEAVNIDITTAYDLNLSGILDNSDNNNSADIHFVIQQDGELVEPDSNTTVQGMISIFDVNGSRIQLPDNSKIEFRLGEENYESSLILDINSTTGAFDLERLSNDYNETFSIYIFVSNSLDEVSNHDFENNIVLFYDGNMSRTRLGDINITMPQIEEMFGFRFVGHDTSGRMSIEGDRLKINNADNTLSYFGIDINNSSSKIGADITLLADVATSNERANAISLEFGFKSDETYLRSELKIMSDSIFIQSYIGENDSETYRDFNMSDFNVSLPHTYAIELTQNNKVEFTIDDVAVYTTDTVFDDISYMNSALFLSGEATAYIDGIYFDNGTIDTDDNGTIDTDDNGTIDTDDNSTIDTDDNGTIDTDDNGTIDTDDNGTIDTDDNGTIDTDDNGTIDTDDNGTIDTDDNGTIDTDDNGTIDTDDNGTIDTDDNGTIDTDDNGTIDTEDNGTIDTDDNGTIDTDDNGTVTDSEDNIHGDDATIIHGTIILPSDMNLTPESDCFDTIGDRQPLSSCNAVFIDLFDRKNEFLGSTMVQPDGNYTLYFEALEDGETRELLVKVHTKINGIKEYFYMDFGADNLIGGDNNSSDSFKSEGDIEWNENMEMGLWLPNVNFLIVSTKETTLDLDLTTKDADKYILSGTVQVPADFTPGENHADNGDWTGWNMVSLTAIDKATGKHYWTEIGQTETTTGNHTYPFSFKLPNSSADYIIRVEKMSDNSGSFDWMEMYLDDASDTTSSSDHDFDGDEQLVSAMGVEWKDNGSGIWIPDSNKTGYFTVNSTVDNIVIDITSYGSDFKKIEGVVTPPENFDLTDANSHIYIEVIDAKTGYWLNNISVDSNGSYSILLGDDVNSEGYILRANVEHWDTNNWENSYWKSFYLDFTDNTTTYTIKDELDVTWEESTDAVSGNFYWIPNVSPLIITDTTTLNIDFGAYNPPDSYSVKGKLVGLPSGAKWVNVYLYNPVNYRGQNAEVMADGSFEVKDLKEDRYIIQVSYSDETQNYKYYDYLIVDDNGDFTEGTTLTENMEIRWVPFDSSDAVISEATIDTIGFDWSTVAYWAPEETATQKTLIDLTSDLDLGDISVPLPTPPSSLVVNLTGVDADKNVNFNLFVRNEPIGRWESNISTVNGATITISDLKERDDYQLQIWVDGMEYWYNGSDTTLSSDYYDGSGFTIEQETTTLNLIVPNDKSTVTATLALGADYSNKTFDVYLWQTDSPYNYAWETFTADESGDVNVSLATKHGLNYIMEIYSRETWNGFTVNIDNNTKSLILAQDSWTVDNDGMWNPKSTVLIDMSSDLDLGTLTPPDLKTVTFALSNLATDSDGNISEDVWISLEDTSNRAWYGAGNGDWSDWRNPTFSNSLSMKVPATTSSYYIYMYSMNHESGLIDMNGTGHGVISTTSDRATIDFSNSSSAKVTWDSNDADTITIANDTNISLTLKSTDDYRSILGTVILDAGDIEAGWMCANSQTDSKGNCGEVDANGSYTIGGLSPTTDEVYSVEYWANRGDTFNIVATWADASSDLTVDMDIASATKISISGTVTDNDADNPSEVVLLDVNGTNWKVLETQELIIGSTFSFDNLPEEIAGHHYEIAVASIVMDPTTGVTDYTVKGAIQKAGTATTTDIASDDTITITIN